MVLLSSGNANNAVGKQSDTPYAFHLLPLSSIFAAAEVAAYGAKKYGESFDDRNCNRIPVEEHIITLIVLWLLHDGVSSLSAQEGNM